MRVAAYAPDMRVISISSFVAVAVVLLTVSISNKAAPGLPGDFQIVHVVTALGIASATILSLTDLGRMRRWAQVGIPLGWGFALILTFMLSTSMSVTPESSVKITMTMAAGLALAAAVILIVRTSANARVLAACVAVGSLGITIPVLLGGPPESRLGGAVFVDRPSGGFSDPNELGSYAALAFFLVIGWMFAVWNSTRQRSLAAICAIGLGGTLALSMSRGAWLGAVVGIVLLLVILPTARRLAFRAALVGLALLPISLLVLPGGGPAGLLIQRATTIASPGSNPYDVRPLTWAEAIRQFREAPVLGNGPGSFRTLSGESPSVIQFYPRRHAHNALLTTLSEVGIVGVLALLGLTAAIAAAIIHSIRKLRQADPSLFRDTTLPLLAGCASGLTAVGIHLIVDYPLRNPTLLITLWAVVGFTLALIALTMKHAGHSHVHSQQEK